MSGLSKEEKCRYEGADWALRMVETVPIFDTIRVSLTRIKQHRSPFNPDKNHIHHLLLRTGLNHIQTTCVLLSVSVLFIGLAILGRNWNMWVLLIADFALATCMTLILWRIINAQIVKEQQNKC